MPTDPTGYISIPLELIRGMAWKRPVRVATTATITIATALNNGDAIDGVTLATGDRVLVKDQSTGSQNGIYVVGASPGRAFDWDQDLTSDVPAEESQGAVIVVLEGTANGGTTWRCTNTGAVVLGTTALTFAQFGTGGAVALDDLSDVAITSPADGQMLRRVAGVWVNVALPQPVVEDDGAGSFAFVSETNGEVIWE
jgi:hypothetical protein